MLDEVKTPTEYYTFESKDFGTIECFDEDDPDHRYDSAKHELMSYYPTTGRVCIRAKPVQLTLDFSTKPQQCEDFFLSTD